MIKYLNYLKLGIRGFFYYTCGHLIAWCKYDKKYLKGKYFEGKLGGLCSSGWQWVVADYKSCRRLKVNQDVPWPVSGRTTVVGPQNIKFHPDDLNNFQGFGNYFQGIGQIVIGRGTYIAPNVGIITANHSYENLDIHLKPKNVSIGENCWIGMNSMILPGVELGVGTVVGAGSVVTKSFTQGHCVIAGNPAKKIKNLA